MGKRQPKHRKMRNTMRDDVGVEPNIDPDHKDIDDGPRYRGLRVDPECPSLCVSGANKSTGTDQYFYRRILSAGEDDDLCYIAHQEALRLSDARRISAALRTMEEEDFLPVDEKYARTLVELVRFARGRSGRGQESGRSNSARERRRLGILTERGGRTRYVYLRPTKEGWQKAVPIGKGPEMSPRFAARLVLALVELESLVPRRLRDPQQMKAHVVAVPELLHEILAHERRLVDRGLRPEP